ncbi:MAG: sulfotransferase [Bacteroidota bacterium]
MTAKQGSTKKIKVIYCMGAGRSGSTVLNTILGSHPDITGGGELQNAGRVFTNDEYCSCGERVSACPFWVPVYQKWSDRIGEGKIQETFQRKYKIEHFKSPFAWMKLATAYKGQADFLKDYLNHTYEFFKAISEVSGKAVVADVSKNPLRAWALMHHPLIDLRIIHLVRDGRAVAWSLKKAYKIDVKAGLEKELKPRPIWRTALFWSVVNRQANFVRKRAQNVCVIRYEDLTRFPAETLQKIGAMAEVDFNPVIDIMDRQDPLPVSHILAGNKLRMAKTIKLKFNKEWTEKMDTKDQETFFKFTRRTMQRFGYGPAGALSPLQESKI